jgi:hypothetical protein
VDNSPAENHKQQQVPPRGPETATLKTLDLTIGAPINAGANFGDRKKRL